MDDDPDDDDPTAEFPAVTEDDEEDGPACGTAAAVTYLLVTFNGDTGVRFAERHCCCYRHVPHPSEVLPAGAELVEVVVEDAWTRTVARDGQAEVTVLAEQATIFAPAYFAPARPC
jgi:hypothetical protein